MQISQIKLVQDVALALIDGKAAIYNLADALEEPLNKIHALLLNNEIIDGSGEIQPWVNYQDIVNTILLFYAMRPYHSFITTAFGPVATDYQRKRR